MALDLLSPEHELFPSEDQRTETDQTRCFGCGESLSGSTYSCRHCPILLHETCAINLPSNIPNHPFHRKHPLELVANPTPNYRGKSHCKFCFNTINGILAYRCAANCSLTIHIRCATSPKFTVGNFPEYKHFGHEHPLVSFENHTDESAGVRCVVCEGGLSGPIHGCIECVFRLHSKCLDFPRKFRHPSHRKHPLLLLVASSLRPSGRVCDVCDHPCRWVVYNCRFCDFDIHVNCVSPPPILKGEIHPHSFDLLLRRCRFLCNGCGREGEGAPYLCQKCNLVLHKDCVSLPHSTKVKQHHHPLVHTFSLLSEEIPDGFRSPQSIECQLCRNNLNPRHGCYYCTQCDYVAHVSCARDTNALDRSFTTEKPHPSNTKQPVGSKLPVAESSSTAASRQACSVDDSTVISRSNQGPLVKILEWETLRDGRRRPRVIQHVCHNKELTRADQVSSDEIQCFACLLPIQDTRFFSCSECEFFLHETCAILPRKFKHWIHNHTLTLRYASAFICGTCKYQSTGFYYICEDCESGIICLRCKMIPEEYTHPGHGHSLCYDRKFEDRHCHACGNLCGTGISHDLNFRAFRCRDCAFFVDFPCLILPRTARHEYHKHPLILSFEDNEQGSSCCVCDICQESRNPKHWFYRCRQCESTPSYFKAHSKCVLGKYPFIKIGSKFVGGRAHEHYLKVFRVDDYPECHKCKEPIVDMALKCEESDCNHTLHWECMLMMR